ncbi:hypothetical protein G6F57_021967 [Rhizopus arrhizus]|nr:hypothetical protein G6F57_021967 [Rhizopus arrhizus]
MQAGQRGQFLADRGRARERDLADHRMGDQVAGNLGRRAEDQAPPARGDAGVDHAVQQGGGGRGGFFGRLHQEGAAGGQRGTQLADDLVDREIPRAGCATARCGHRRAALRWRTSR